MDVDGSCSGDDLDLTRHRPYRPGMDRRRFLLTSLAGALGAPLAAEAQQASGTPRIGYMSFNLTAGDPRSRHAFFQGLRDLGYEEGKNLVIEYRDAEGKPDRFPAAAASPDRRTCHGGLRCTGVGARVA